VTAISTAHSRQLHVRVPAGLLGQLKSLAAFQRHSLSQLVRSVLARAIVEAKTGSGSTPNESAIREMAILIAVELVLKLQEASIPGGVTLSRRLLEDAARAAIERIGLVEARLQEDGRG
jgi:hypothetical protein